MHEQVGWDVRAVIRRLVDIVAAAVLLVLTLPVLVLVALISATTLRAWPFFTQERIGRGGEVFGFLKIRTLPPFVPRYTDKYALEDHVVPKVMWLIRGTHLDELPQLLLVLRGRMSLVGPRPEMRCFHDAMEPAFAATRVSVRPGCTGLWQVSAAGAGLISEAPEWDRFYLEQRTWRMDAWILFRTVVLAVRRGRSGLERIEDIPRWVCRPLAVAGAPVV